MPTIYLFNYDRLSDSKIRLDQAVCEMCTVKLAIFLFFLIRVSPPERVSPGAVRTPRTCLATPLGQGEVKCRKWEREMGKLKGEIEHDCGGEGHSRLILNLKF